MCGCPSKRPKVRHPNWGHPDHDACGTGFIAQLNGPATHDILTYSLQALERLSHRGGVDADGASGDGAGLLTSLPIDFFRARAAEDHMSLDELFAVGMLFAPAGRAADARVAIEDSIGRSKLRLVGWRRVPTNSNALGQRAFETMPEIWQFFIEPASARSSAPNFPQKFERSLALLRKRAEGVLPERCYLCSLSSQTIVYKGLLTPWQFPRFYEDLHSADFTAQFAIFHQRYSTNTEPSWQLAQPFRYVAHNGEINTVISNRRWLRAREREIRRRIGVGKWFHLLEENVSDSASFDNALELKLLEGKSVEAAMLALVPPAFSQDPFLSSDVRAALEALSREGEPWDGPAALVFSDGRSVGVKLDRNGLRPMRYTVTHDGLVIAGSETGLLDLEDSRVAERHRLGPGEILLATPRGGSLQRWRDLLKSVTAEIPRKALTRATVLRLNDSAARPKIDHPKRVAAAAGWSDDQYKILFRPLLTGKEADWSMGDDAPPAFLSAIHRPLWDYCKQRFAQVTNPPIDPLRESHVMSLEVPLGHGHFLPSPILSEAELASLCVELPPVKTIDFTFSSTLGVPGARRCFTQCKTTPLSNGDRPGLLLLSDRAIGPDRAALPALLAAASAWKNLIHQGLADIPLVVESAQIFETHHVAMLLAAGASAVVPYLAEEFAESEEPGGFVNVRKGILGGLRKVLARMGISTLASYRNSHLFEMLGLDEDICREYFEDAACYAGTKTLDSLFQDYLAMHAAGYGAPNDDLTDHGLYRFRKGAELHATSPELVRRMHAYVRKPEPAKFSVYEELAKADGGPTFLRDLLDMLPEQPIPLDGVEPAESILARFSTQAMSLGSLSPEAHKTLSLAMNQLGGRSNTGEGGEDTELYKLSGAANKIKQVASGRFGVTAEYLVRAEELEIKMAQGSKPGEGGQLPARKVTEYIARIRHATPGTPLISPPPHHDIYSIEDLAQLIHDLRAVNPRARIGVKLVSGTGVGVIAAGVAKAGADVITVSGHNGGTGSSPLTSIKNTGLPWEIGLRETHETLLRAGLRSRVKLRVDGGLRFSRDILIAATLGADEFGFGTAALVAIGCVMARQCHLNTCPVGIATQDETLRTRFNGKPEMVVSFFRSLAEEIRNGLAQLGVRSLTELRGWYDRLETKSGLDALLVIPVSKPGRVLPQQTSVLDGGVEETEMSFEHALTSGSPSIHNFHRSIGAHLSGERMTERLAHKESPSLVREFTGTAGQSFGAFLTSNLALKLSGEANDYVGKGLSGGTIVVRASHNASKRGDVLVGNTVLYGATSGQLFVSGQAGERFAVRNSGAVSVVEGLGQHGCEYMTGGIVAVLGPIGLNFGSGMTGGLAYILRSHTDHVLNLEFVQAHELEEQEEASLRRLLESHVALTDSPVATRLLSRAHLPFLRIQPLHFQGTVEGTWAAIPGLSLEPLSMKPAALMSVPESAAPHYA